MIYRGYTIEVKDGVWTIFLNGKKCFTTHSEPDAFGWIDTERRKAARQIVKGK